MTVAAVNDRDRVLEIGPGLGVLTQRLIAAAQAVVAVEIDRDLCTQLVKKLGNHHNFLLLQDDFLAIDLDSQLAAWPNFQHPTKVVANIPYNITGPILEKLLGNIANPALRPFTSITLLVQKEVAARLTASPSSKAFGALTIRVQYLADCVLVCPVPARDFSPPPKVDSAAIHLTPRPYPIAARQPDWLDALVKMGFSSRRKMLRNNLQSAIDREQLGEILVGLGVSSAARAEDLSVHQWVELSNLLPRVS